MNKRIRAEWVKRLRSNEYTKMKGMLHNKDCFCVMGILCDIYLEEHDEQWEEHAESDKIGLLIHGTSANIPQEVVIWSGLGTRQPLINISTIHGSPHRVPLIALNDNANYNYSFKQMADLIEEQL